MENVEKMVRKRNILLKSFLIIYALLLISVAMLFVCHEWMYSLMEYFYGLGSMKSAILIAQSMILMKIIAFTIFLAPALALQWEIVSERKKVEKGE